MNTTIKRYVISTLETFFVAFLWTFLLQMENIINTWVLPTKEVVISALIAWVISWLKVAVKVVRELIQKYYETK